MTVADLLVLIKDGGALAVLILAGVGLFRKWWVPYWFYERVLDENIRLQAALDKTAANVGTAIDLVAPK